jgi:hypothetical protein
MEAESGASDHDVPAATLERAHVAKPCERLQGHYGIWGLSNDVLKGHWRPKTLIIARDEQALEDLPFHPGAREQVDVAGFAVHRPDISTARPRETQCVGPASCR